MRLFLILSLLSLSLFNPSAHAGGDEIELKDGTHIFGNIIAQGNRTQIPTGKPTRASSILIDSTQIWIATSDGVKKINTSDIKTIHFGARAVILKTEPVPAPT